MANQKNIISFIKSNSYARFLLIFTCAFILLMALYPMIKSDVISLSQGACKTLFANKINKNSEYNRKVSILKDATNKDAIVVSAVYLDKSNTDGSMPVKHISVNIFNEYYAPISLLLALTIASLFSVNKKIKTILISLSLGGIFFSFKLFASSIDNYSNPEFALVQLPFFINGLVYSYNYFISLTGASSNFVIIVIIWLLSSINKDDFEALLEKFSQKL